VSKPRLSVVIPTYNGLPVLKDCLVSVMHHAPAGTEVIVVDDGSSDGTSDWVARHYSDVRVVRLERNYGFCFAVNRGIEAARAEIVQTLNNDTIVTAGWAEAALKLFKDAEVGSVAPLVWLLDRPGLVDSAGLDYHIAGYSRNRGNREPRANRFLQVEEVFGATASAAFYRRSALLEVGGFPEELGAYYDDVEVAFRLRWAGYRCLFTPASQVFHRESWSYRRQGARVRWLFYRNEEQVFWQHMLRISPHEALLRHLTMLLCSIPIRLCRGDLLPFVMGKWSGWLAARRGCGRAASPLCGEVVEPAQFVSADLIVRTPLWRLCRLAVRLYLRTRYGPGRSGQVWAAEAPAPSVPDGCEASGRLAA